MSYKPYEKYKPSGIEWIGDIPEGWEIKRLKYLGKIINGFAFNSNDFSLEGVRVIKISNIQHMCLDFTDESFLPIDFLKDYSDYSVKDGELVIALTRPIISTGIKAVILQNTMETFLLNQRTAVFKPNFNVVLLYLYYLVNSESFLISFSSKITETNQPNISPQDISDILITLPPLTEQRAIAEYLDKKTTEIDSLVQDKERLISLLGEKRKSIISEAVTKGLDSNVKMKPSGIEWIGDIPEGWEVKKIKSICNIFGRIGFRGYRNEDIVTTAEEGAITLSPRNIVNNFFNLLDCTYITWEKYHESPEIKIALGDIIIVKTGSSIGKAAIIQHIPHPMTINPQLAVFKDIKCNRHFLFYLIISVHIQNKIGSYNTGGTIPTITQSTLSNYFLTLPSLPEQQAIAEYLDKKTTEIDSLVHEVEIQIEKLKEYRQAVISEAVTGKIDVRGDS